jgi:hypothetical protein
MGRRARKRGPAERPPAPAQMRHGRAVAPNPLEERPKAPWHPFPLVELAVLVGIVLIVLGLLVVHGERGRLLLIFGLALGSLGGLDTALREHFSGFRAHSMLLAGAPAVLAAVVLVVVGAPQIVVVLAAVIVFAAAFLAAQRAFRTRSGVRTLRR